MYIIHGKHKSINHVELSHASSQEVVYTKRMNTQTIQPTGCCQPFDPTSWLEIKKITWQKKLFVKDHVTSFMHIPLNMGKQIVKNMALIDKAKAKTSEQLMLTDEQSMWGSDIYIAVTKDVPGAQMTTLSGTYYAKVFEGPYQNAGKWAKGMIQEINQRKEKLLKLYFSYTTCPACAKAYGKNYVVLFAQIQNP